MTSSLSSRYFKRFGHGPVLFPVIHVQNPIQTLESAEIAAAAGCAGVFLINHSGGGSEELFRVWEGVRKVHPLLWIGLNCLDLPADRAVRRLPKDLAGWWTDNALIGEDSASQTSAGRIKDLLARRELSPLYFGGVAFKHQRPVKDPAVAARHAQSYMDVVVTSGPAGGIAPDLDKIRQMRVAIEGHPLGIASGVTAANASRFADIGVNAFLVSGSITAVGPDKIEVLDLHRILELKQALSR